MNASTSYGVSIFFLYIYFGLSLPILHFRAFPMLSCTISILFSNFSRHHLRHFLPTPGKTVILLFSPLILIKERITLTPNTTPLQKQECGVTDNSFRVIHPPAHPAYFPMIFSLNYEDYTFIAPHKSLRFNCSRDQSRGMYHHCHILL